MRYMRVQMKPVLAVASAPCRRPAMPYTVRPNTQAQMIWNGVIAAIWEGGRFWREGGGAGRFGVEWRSGLFWSVVMVPYV
jgi:hypothetical protein